MHGVHVDHDHGVGCGVGDAVVGEVDFGCTFSGSDGGWEETEDFYFVISFELNRERGETRL